MKTRDAEDIECRNSNVVVPKGLIQKGNLKISSSEKKPLADKESEWLRKKANTFSPVCSSDDSRQFEIRKLQRPNWS